MTSATRETNTREPDVMTLEEMAQRMGRSYHVVYELARADKLPVPVIRVGRRYLFSRKAYQAVMDAQHEPEPQSA